MPVLEIRALPQNPEVNVTTVMKAVCCAVAAAAQLPSDKVWATWSTIGSGQYVEGERAAERQPAATHPPIVRLIALAGRSDAMVEDMIVAAAQTLEKQLGLEAGNVFLTYSEVKGQHLYKGGKTR